MDVEPLRIEAVPEGGPPLKALCALHEVMLKDVAKHLGMHKVAMSHIVKPKGPRLTDAQRARVAEFIMGQEAARRC